MLVVTVFSVVERLLGFIYRIFLSRSLGAELLGVYQVALSVVGLIMTITASGIPITVSRIMTKHDAENQTQKNFSTVTAGIVLSIIASLPVALIIYLVPSVSGIAFYDERSFEVFKVILPGIVITSVYSVIRGYFWGKKSFLTYSIIELLEEIVMLIAGVILINGAVGGENGLIGAGKAVLISYVFSFITAVLLYFLRVENLKTLVESLSPLYLRQRL
ncbi:MAG: oligosaccharide flippase family protein [Clostridia bacterium]|nr:oligosaccharide flippase family protein [Clostridia bacterium]